MSMACIGLDLFAVEFWHCRLETLAWTWSLFQRVREPCSALAEQLGEKQQQTSAPGSATHYTLKWLVEQHNAVLDWVGKYRINKADSILISTRWHLWQSSLAPFPSRALSSLLCSSGAHCCVNLDSEPHMQGRN